MQFVCIFCHICRKFENLISQGNVDSMGFVANFVRFPAVQKFRKLVKI